ncbi:MAG: leucine-rich repeat domain-containing protein [Bacteroidales bacterium]|nr:leucine-rich repeat domain-containing protein [Bacteroidales bacterium]
MKKRIITQCIIAFLGTFTTQVWAYSGSVVAPSGQYIYYTINNSSQTIKIVSPENNGWGYYVKPTGSLVIPDSITHNGTVYPVTEIYSHAFYNCNGLTSVTIPITITNIGPSAFQGCSSLDSVEFNAANCTFTGTSSTKAFAGCPYITSFTFGNSVSVIPQLLCSGMSYLGTIIIPNSVTTIGSAAFSNCTGLTSITLGNNVSIIGQEAFKLCKNLTNVIIPDSVTSIGNYAFMADSSLQTVTIGKGVTSIGKQAFEQCIQLDTIYMMPLTPPTLAGEQLYQLPFWNNAPGRVFILNGCSYDAYYVDVWEHPQWESWKYYNGSLCPPYYDISVNVLSNDTTRGSANVVLGPGNRIVRCDSTVVIQAIANSPEYRFDHWDNGSTDNPITITLVGDSTIIAYFVRNIYTLTANANDDNYGFVSFPAGDTATFGDTLIVVASPTAHYHVDNWSGTGIVNTSTNKDTVWVVMNEDLTITCNFVIDKHTVAVSVAQNDTACGSVTGDGMFDYGTTITLHAIANNGYRFDHWSTGSTDNPYTLTVTNDTTIIAYFVPNGTQGIGEVCEENIRISVFNGRVCVEGITNEEVRVYDITGRMVQNRALPSGVYIVKVGTLPAQKVVVMR